MTARTLLGMTLILSTAGACLVPLDDEELFVYPSEEDRAESALLPGPLPTPPLGRLATLSETELAALFADGTAQAIPEGENDGVPLLPRWVRVIPVLAQVYEGSIWEHRTGPDGRPQVRLRDKFLRTRHGHLVTLFEGEVTRGRIADVRVRGVRRLRGRSFAGPRAVSAALLLVLGAVFTVAGVRWF